MKKYLKVFCLFLLVIIGCVACGKKELISTDEFKASMESYGLDIYDITDEYEYEDEYSLTSAVIAANDDYQINYFSFEDSEMALAVFEEEKELIDESSSAKHSTTSVQVGDYCKYSTTADDYYYIVVRNDNTIIHAEVPESEKDTVQNIFKGFGY